MSFARLTSSLAILLSVGILLGYAHGYSGGQNKSKEILVSGVIVGVEMPEFPWPMEFQSLKIFYLRISKIHKGHEKAKYLRVAYGYNPSLNPKTALPEEMFDGKSVWQMRLSRWDIFDEVVEVSRSPGDWMYEANAQIEGETRWVPIRNKCVATDGNQNEAEALEKLGKLKGYWLDWDQVKRIRNR